MTAKTLTHVDCIDSLAYSVDQVETFPAGRVCASEGCETRLSRYNPDSYCPPHRPDAPLCYFGHHFRVCPSCDTITEYLPRKPSKRCGSCGAEWGDGW